MNSNLPVPTYQPKKNTNKQKKNLNNKQNGTPAQKNQPKQPPKQTPNPTPKLDPKQDPKNDEPEEDTQDYCLTCTEKIELYAIGDCNHKEVCHLCSLRMRELYSKKSCPICKSNLDQVIITPDPSLCFQNNVALPPVPNAPSNQNKKNDTNDTPPPKINYSKRDSLIFDSKLNIYYDTPEAQDRVRQLWRISCPFPNCRNLNHPNSQMHFSTVSNLEKHLWNKHYVQFCPVCLTYKPIFLYEQKLYTSASLKIHCQYGDDESNSDHPSNMNRNNDVNNNPDNLIVMNQRPPTANSNKGGLDFHPSCEFCNFQLLDTDHLYNHLKNDHETCGLCERSGIFHQYYRNFQGLQAHYEDQHYPCLDQKCWEEGIVFPNELELRAHSVTHLSLKSGKTLSRSELRRAATLPLQLFFDEDNSRNRGSRRRNEDYENNRQSPMFMNGRSGGGTSAGGGGKKKSNAKLAMIPRDEGDEYSNNNRQDQNPRPPRSTFPPPSEPPAPPLSTTTHPPQTPSQTTTTTTATTTAPTTNASMIPPSQTQKGKNKKNKEQEKQEQEPKVEELKVPIESSREESQEPGEQDQEEEEEEDNEITFDQSRLLNEYNTLSEEQIRRRNAELIVKVKQTLSNDPQRFSYFREISTNFRTNSITASRYLEQFFELFGGTESQEIFTELVTMLPDQEKRQQLLDAYRQRKSQNTNNNNQNKKKKKKKKKPNNGRTDHETHQDLEKKNATNRQETQTTKSSNYANRAATTSTSTQPSGTSFGSSGSIGGAGGVTTFGTKNYQALVPNNKQPTITDSTFPTLSSTVNSSAVPSTLGSLSTPVPYSIVAGSTSYEYGGYGGYGSSGFMNLPATRHDPFPALPTTVTTPSGYDDGFAYDDYESPSLPIQTKPGKKGRKKEVLFRIG